MIPNQRVNPNGLHQRYRIQHADGSPVDHLATYFVLRLDNFGRDGLHAAACRAAAIAYADYVESGAAPHLAQIGRDLRTLVQNLDGGDHV